MYALRTTNIFNSCKLLAMLAWTYTLHKAIKYYKSNRNKLLRQNLLSKTLRPKNGPVNPFRYVGLKANPPRLEITDRATYASSDKRVDQDQECGLCTSTHAGRRSDFPVHRATSNMS